ncbi:hypothetical protein [Martelella limonii]|uniref:hypothetical protein n=1 Tax=Martelella limonii TaxID=1647649 RepID=UPI001580ABD1|nr:hypothetical protein [Martelella limonii]
MRRRDTLTEDLFDWQPPKVAAGYEEDVAGRGALDSRISRTVAKALKDAREAGKTRAEIAADMSRYLGRTVSEDMLNKWSSEAATHRITLDAFIALIDATKEFDLLGFVPSRFRYVAVPESYRDLIVLHLAKQKQEEMNRFVERLEADQRTKFKRGKS